MVVAYLRYQNPKYPAPQNPKDMAPALLLCPNCNDEMLLFGVEPDGPKRDTYTFECDNCDRLEVRGVPIR
jgi:hypothetical protein